MRSLLEGIPAEMTRDYPKIVEQLAAEYRATLDSDDAEAQKKRAELHPRFPAAGGAQDNVLAKCHQVTKLVRYQAGLTVTADPGTAQPGHGGPQASLSGPGKSHVPRDHEPASVIGRSTQKRGC